MKLKTDPDNLKPGQLFDARPMGEVRKEYMDRTFHHTDDVRVWDSPNTCFLKCENDFFTEVSHPEMVSKLVKPGEQILAEMSGADMHLLHMIMGLCGEAGELLDALKKSIIYRKPLDRENVVEELGDAEFYLEGIRQGVGVTREECLEHNIAKLSKRYEGLNYSNQAAVDRADKTPEVKGPLSGNSGDSYDSDAD